MKVPTNRPILAIVIASALPLLAQDTPPPQQPSQTETGTGGGWRRFDEPRRDTEAANRDQATAPGDSFDTSQDRDDRTRDTAQQSQAPYQRPPAQIQVPAGTWITIRVNEFISSDRSLSGDQFLGTIAQPLVADGFVIARRGQTIAGRVVDVQRAGRIKGSSRLGLELTEIGIVDGRQIPVRSQLIQFTGGTSLSRDATSIGTVTAAGAAVGAAADGGFGAGMGAIAGAGASVIGVLLTRGRSTVIDPEAELTFRTMEPISLSTERTEQAFQSVRQGDYEQRRTLQRRPVQTAPYGWGSWGYPGWGGWGWGGYPYWGPGFYGRGYYGSGITIISGRGFGGYRGFGGGYRGGGYYRGGGGGRGRGR